MDAAHIKIARLHSRMFWTKQPWTTNDCILILDSRTAQEELVHSISCLLCITPKLTINVTSSNCKHRTSECIEWGSIAHTYLRLELNRWSNPNSPIESVSLPGESSRPQVDWPRMRCLCLFAAGTGCTCSGMWHGFVAQRKLAYAQFHLEQKLPSQNRTEAYPTKFTLFSPTFRVMHIVLVLMLCTALKRYHPFVLLFCCLCGEGAAANGQMSPLYPCTSVWARIS